jgi:hypothetical protein
VEQCPDVRVSLGRFSFKERIRRRIGLVKRDEAFRGDEGVLPGLLVPLYYFPAASPRATP